MKKALFLTLILTGFTALKAQVDSIPVKDLRVQSGVDPTRIISRFSYTVRYFDRSNNRSLMQNRAAYSLGINEWSIGLRPELITRNTGDEFQTAGGDLRLLIFRRLLETEKHSLGLSADLTLPTGRPSFGGQYLSWNPSLTYAYTIKEDLIVAASAQYLFDLQRSNGQEGLSEFTLRPFLAKFFDSGWLFVFEPRLVQDFQQEDFQLILTPIVGKAIARGLNLNMVFEFPVDERFRNNRGWLLQFSLVKTFGS